MGRTHQVLTGGSLSYHLLTTTMKAVFALLLVCLVQISSAEEQENIASEGNLLLQREVREAARGEKCDKECRQKLRKQKKKDRKRTRQLKKKKNSKGDTPKKGKKGKNGAKKPGKAGERKIKGRTSKKKKDQNKSKGKKKRPAKK